MTRQAIHDGLKDQHRNAIIQVLAAHPRIERAILFGSRAMGTYSSASDIDIALVGDALDATDLARLAGQMEELNVPQKVDLLLHRSIQSPKLLEHIEKHGLVVWERDSQAASGTSGSFDWEMSDLGAVCEIFDGPHATPEKTECGPVFLGISNLVGGRLDLSNAEHLSEADFARWTRRVTPQCEDIVFSYETRLGEAALLPVGLRCCLGRRLGLLRPNRKRADCRFLLYYWLGPQFQAEIRSRTVPGSTVDRIPLISLGAFPIQLPPLPEQRRIAAVLGALDDKIELNRRMNQTLEAMAQALFKSWFIDFDGHTDLVDSELGPIPRGWEIKSLYDSATYINGAAYRDFQFSDEAGALPIIKIAELKDGVTAQTKRTAVAMDSRYMVSNGDLLFSWSGNPDTSIDTFVWTGGAGWLNQHIFKVIPVAPEQTIFIYYLLRHLKPVFAEIARDKQTTGLGHVTAGDMRRMLVVNPPAQALTAFNVHCRPLFDRWFRNQLESRTLAALRDTLLPKLISGEIRVPDIEGLVEEAV